MKRYSQQPLKSILCFLCFLFICSSCAPSPVDLNDNPEMNSSVSEQITQAVTDSAGSPLNKNSNREETETSVTPGPTVPEVTRDPAARHRAIVAAKILENQTQPIPIACPNGCKAQMEGCEIKGNISHTSKEKIFHVPGQNYYDQTIITPMFGERWFCTEEEAIANGLCKAYR